MTALDTSICRTAAGGTIRIIQAPWTVTPNREAGLAVLLAWCRANGLPTDRILDREIIEIHQREGENPARPVYYEIMYREVQPPPAGRPREAHLKVRTVPLLVEPQGLLAGETCCGHVHLVPPPLVDAGWYTCDVGVDPVDGRHPGPHAGPPGEDPNTGRIPPGSRRDWPNEHPGQQPFRDGLPYVGDLPPDAAHALVLARLDAVVARRPRVNRAAALIAIGGHARGLIELTGRHGPRTTLAGIVCDHDFVTGAAITPWPCPDYRAATAGIVAFAPAVDQ